MFKGSEEDTSGRRLSSCAPVITDNMYIRGSIYGSMWCQQFGWCKCMIEEIVSMLIVVLRADKSFGLTISYSFQYF